MTEEKSVLWTKDFIIICVVNIFLYFSFQILMPTFPLFIQELGGDDNAVGLNSFVMTGVALLLRPLSGLALDRIGRRAVLLAGLGMAIAASLLFGMFRVIWVLTLLRVLQGAAWGSTTTATTTIATDLFPKKRFAEAMGIFSLTMAVSFALAPGAGLILYDAIGFENLSLTALGISVIVLVLSLPLRYRKIERSSEKKRFTPFEKSALPPSVVIIFPGIALGAEVSFMSLYGQNLSLGTLGEFFFVYSGMLAVTRFFSGRLISRLGINRIILPAFILMMVAMVLLFLAKSLPLVLAAAIIQGAAYGSLQVSLQTLAVSSAHGARIGAANATFLTGLDAGVSLGGIIGGVLSAAFGYSFMLLIMAVPLALGMVLHTYFTRRTVNSAESSAAEII